jgi:transglutaminase-like putative cysteine protease
MLIRLGYDMQFETTANVPMVMLLKVHPSREKDLREPDEVRTDPVVDIENFLDRFGNRGTRLVAPPGRIRLHNSTLVEDSGRPDPQGFDAREIPVEHLPVEVLPYLMNSRYCEVDLLSSAALELFGKTPRGWSRVQAVCDWVQGKVSFGYKNAISSISQSPSAAP